jgi:hypothetical protein
VNAQRAQQLQALELANRTRLAKATLKRDLAAMPSADAVRFVAALIKDGDETVLKCRLGELLLACRGLGQEALRAVTRHAEIVTADRRVSELTPRQHAALLTVLRSPALMPPRFRRSAVSS